MGAADYVTMNLRVTPEARDAWDALCREHNVTRSALAEAIGLVMIEQGGSLSDAVEEAKRISRERLRRSDQ